VGKVITLLYKSNQIMADPARDRR